MGLAKLAVGEEGTIRAAVLHPGVKLKIGNVLHEVTTTMYNVEFRLQDSTLSSRSA